MKSKLLFRRLLKHKVAACFIGMGLALIVLGLWLMFPISISSIIAPLFMYAGCVCLVAGFNTLTLDSLAELKQERSKRSEDD
jgi:uncharacterized membrane protein HdeD (DUF308 family)